MLETPNQYSQKMWEEKKKMINGLDIIILFTQKNYRVVHSMTIDHLH